MLNPKCLIPFLFLVAGCSAPPLSTSESNLSDSSVPTSDSSIGTGSSRPAFTPLYEEVFGDFPTRFEAARALAKDSRLLASAELEAYIINQAIAIPGYCTPSNRLTRFFAYPYALNSADLSSFIPVEEIVQASDYMELRADASSRSALIASIVGRGYTVKDDLTINDDGSTAGVGALDYLTSDHIFDIHATDHVASTNFGSTMNRGLFRFSANGKPIPEIAKSITPCDHGFLIELGEAYWRDYQGTRLRKIDAADFVSAYDAYVNSTYTPAPFLGYSAIDSDHIRITTDDAEPWAIFSERLNFPMATDYMSAIPDYGNSFSSTVYSDSVYSVSTEENGILLTRFVDDADYPSRIHLTRTSPNVERFVAGEGDLVFCGVQDLDREDIAPYRIEQAFGGRSFFFNFSVDDPHYVAAMKNVHFRRAVMLSINVLDMARHLGRVSAKQTPCRLSDGDYAFASGAYADYAEAVAALVEDIGTVEECMAAAKSELGAGFFEEPVTLPLPAYPDQLEQGAAIKESIESAFHGEVVVELNSIPFDPYFQGNATDEPICFLSAVRLPLSVIPDPLFAFFTLVDPGSYVLGNLGL